MPVAGEGDKKDARHTPVAHAETAISSSNLGGDAVDAGETDPELAISDALIGQRIAERYEVLSLLGRGGMGSVYIAEHMQLKKRVALKVLSEELRGQQELVTRFLKEARAAAQIGHPNIVDVFDLGELPGGGAFIAMALLEGNDLQSEIDDVLVMPVARARLIVGEICRALAAAHAKGIVHRDMKPANVFLSRTSDGLEQVKVLDFGIAQIQEPTGEQARLTQTGAIVGTPTYMSPEQGRGDRADHRADIYSVGCILYHLITGVPPFEAGSLMGVITKHLLDAPVPPSERNPELGIAPEVDAVVLRALAKKPADRYQTMKEMWTALAELSDDTSQAWPDHYSGRFVRLGTPTPAPRRPSHAESGVIWPATPTPAPPRSRAGLWIAGGLVLVAAAIGGVLIGRVTAPRP